MGHKHNDNNSRSTNNPLTTYYLVSAHRLTIVETQQHNNTQDLTRVKTPINKLRVSEAIKSQTAHDIAGPRLTNER